MRKFGRTSISRLIGIDSRLIIWATYFLNRFPEYDISILEGLRTVERQKELVAQGVSWTMASDHLIGKAVDIKPSTYSWDEPTEKWIQFAKDGETAAVELGLDIKNLGLRIHKDYVHFSIKS